MANSWWYEDENGGWYFFGGDGAMKAAQWVEWKGEWYYLTESGKMAVSTIRWLYCKRPTASGYTNFQKRLQNEPIAKRLPGKPGSPFCRLVDEGQDREDRQRPVVPSGGADDANDREDETEDVEDPADNVENRDMGQDARHRPEDEEV